MAEPWYKVKSLAFNVTSLSTYPPHKITVLTRKCEDGKEQPSRTAQAPLAGHQ